MMPSNVAKWCHCFVQITLWHCHIATSQQRGEIVSRHTLVIYVGFYGDWLLMACVSINETRQNQANSQQTGFVTLSLMSMKSCVVSFFKDSSNVLSVNVTLNDLLSFPGETKYMYFKLYVNNNTFILVLLR